MAQSPQQGGVRQFAMMRSGLDKKKAARVYIESYYNNLIKSRQEREARRKNYEKELEGLDKKTRKEKEKELQQTETAFTRNLRSKMSRRDFASVKLVGRGAFGEVRLVQHKESGQYFALKVINKDFMIQRNQLAHARAERDAMVEHDDPGVVSMYYSFQDEDFLYLVMEFLPGGDLMNLLIMKDILPEDQTRFYMAELILAVHAVHVKYYIHRDLKPDNILIDSQGHIKLSDFGLCTSGHESHLSSFYQTTVPKDFDKNSLNVPRPPEGIVRRRSSWKKFRKAMSYSTVGTSNYMAPEILMEKGYDKMVDWWSVGVIMYECLVGYAPFSCEDTTQTCLMILDWRHTLEFPKDANLSPEAVDLMSKLICDAENRIGFEKIVKHPFFKGIDWKNLRSQPAPWKPELSGPTDCRYFDTLEDDGPDWWDKTDEELNDPSTSTLLKNLNQKHLPFVGWTFKRFVTKGSKPTASSLFDEEPSDPSTSTEDSHGNAMDASDSLDSPSSTATSSTSPPQSPASASVSSPGLDKRASTESMTSSGGSSANSTPRKDSNTKDSDKTAKKDDKKRKSGPLARKDDKK